jgi:integrase
MLVFHNLNSQNLAATMAESRYHRDKILLCPSMVSDRISQTLPFYPDSLQRAVKTAIRQIGITRHASCHTFRHSFVTY